MKGQSNAARELREHGHRFVRIVDRLQRVQRRVMQIARRHLRMARAGVEQRWRTWHIVMRGDQPIKLDGLDRRLRQPAGHAQKEVLRCLNDLARERIAQQIAIIDGAQPKVFEAVAHLVVNRLIEFARMSAHKLRRRRVDQSLRCSMLDGLREGVQVLSGNFFLDRRQQQARG